MSARCRILLVDDEADNRRIFGDALEAVGYAVRKASSAQEAFDAALESEPDLVLSDVSMPGGGRILAAESPEGGKAHGAESGRADVGCP